MEGAVFMPMQEGERPALTKTGGFLAIPVVVLLKY